MRLFVLCFCLILTPGQLCAEKLYKFVDDNGRVTFTDKAVGDGALKKVTQVRNKRPAKRFYVQNRGSKATPVLYAVNSYFGPVEAEFVLKDIKNMTVKRHTAQRTTIPAAGEMRVITMNQT